MQSSNQSNYHHRVVSLRLGLDSAGHLAPFPLGCGLTANYKGSKLLLSADEQQYIPDFTKYMLTNVRIF